MASTFTPYPIEVVRAAAQAYGLDPNFVEAVYAAESSRGQDPNAMRARTVKRKSGNTIVRGPFQLEDDTTNDLIRKHKLGNVNVNDPDVHLDLALRLMKDLEGRYKGDYDKMAQAYLGGPGSVGTQNRDELGTSVGQYSNRIISEMDRLRGAPPDTMVAGDLPPGMNYSQSTEEILRDIPMTPFNVGAEADIFGVGDMQPMMADANPFMSIPGIGEGIMSPRPYGSRDMMGVPETLTGELQPRDNMPDYERLAWIENLVDEELAGRDFSIA